MSTSALSLPGVFPRLNTGGVATSLVMADFFTPGVSAWTPGALVSTRLDPGPSVSQKWTIIGFSFQAKLGLVLPSAGTPLYGKLGKLWLGVTSDTQFVNSSLDPNTGKASVAKLPNDISTFTIAWDGENDSIRVITNIINLGGPLQVPVNDQDSTLVLGSYIFPTSIEVQPGAQLGMCAVLTPSLIFANADGLGRTPNLAVTSIGYSLLYNR